MKSNLFVMQLRKIPSHDNGLITDNIFGLID